MFGLDTISTFVSQAYVKGLALLLKDILDDPSRTYGVDLDSYKHIKLYAK